MKKFFLAGLMFCCTLMGQQVYADQGNDQQQPPADHAVGPVAENGSQCWCHYEPCFYNTYRCVEEPQYYTERCCRQVPKYYEVQRCRYVPDYYCETICRYEPEYYDVQKCRTCTRTICDTKCDYVPNYYYKQVCNPCPCPPPCDPCAR